MKKLDLAVLLQEAKAFAECESEHDEPSLYGITDGKAVGTYLEQKFTQYLLTIYEYEPGNSASGIDLPALAVDIKVTSIKQPQSSCPFESARQKIYGLGYNLLIFVYEKVDNIETQTSRLKIRHTIYIEKERTADFQMTKSLLQILENEGNVDDIIAFLLDNNLPIDEIGAKRLAEEISNNPPRQGFLTISNALQWRLQYTRVIQKAGEVDGIYRVWR